MSTFSNTTKHSVTTTNARNSILALWDDPVLTWGSTTAQWDGAGTVFTDGVKHSAIMANLTKN